MNERYEGWDAHDLRDHLLQTERELRKALAWIANARHHDSCSVVRGDEKCICGRSALLASDEATAVK